MTSAGTRTTQSTASSHSIPVPPATTRLAAQISGIQGSPQRLDIKLASQPPIPSSQDMPAELVVEPDHHARSHYARLQISRMAVDVDGREYTEVEDVPANTRPATREPAVGREILLVDDDAYITLDADRDLKALMLGRLASNQNSPMSVPVDSLIDKPLNLYKQALNDPKVLAWIESKGLALDTLTIQEDSISATITLNGVTSTETFTVYDTSGWWQVSAQVLAARQVLDPGNFGLPYVNEDRKLVPCDVILDFYGVVPPNPDEDANVLANDLKENGWPEITADEKAELEKECHCVKELIREAKARVQLISELGDLVKGKGDSETLLLSGQYSESASDSPLAHKSLAILHHLDDFFKLPEMMELCREENIDCDLLPVRISENKIEVFIHSSRWYDLTGLVRCQSRLITPFNKLLQMVKDTGNVLYSPLSFDLQQILTFSGFSAPTTAGEVRNIIRWLETTLPKATPLGDYGAELLADSQSPVRLTSEERAKVINVANGFSHGANSIIDALGADLLINTSADYKRNNADELLSKMFEKDQSDSWGHELLQALDWYGSGQTASSEQTQKLLLAAIILEVDPEAPGKPGIIAGYDLFQPKNLGRDLTVVRTEIEQHLIDHKRVSSQAAPLVAHLFLADVAPEFLAQDLIEGIQVGTATWMTLSLGAAIAEALEPGCSRVMTTDQLMALALLEPTTPEQQLLFKSLAVDISITWAVMNGVVKRRADCSYSFADYKTAAQKFATQRNDISKTLKAFKRELHTRWELAAKELRSVFPITLKRLTEPAKGLQLPTERIQLPIEEIIIGPRQIEEFNVEYKGSTKSIVEAYMDGESSGSWEMCDVQMPDQSFDIGWGKLPDLNKIFTDSVDLFFDERQKGFVSATKYLVATLPLEDRQHLEAGEVKFFTLREETGKPEEDETPSDRAAFRGRQGTLLRCEYQDGEDKKVSYFEVFPGRMSIIKRMDLPSVLLLNGETKTEKARVGRGGTVNVGVQRGTELPFDFTAYAKGSEPIAGVKSQKLIIEELGERLPAKAGQLNDPTLVPNSYFSTRTSDIVDRIINDNLLQGERDFLFEKAKGTTTEEENRAYREKVHSFLLQLIPFVGCTEDLRSGDRIRFINGAFGCFTDLASSLNAVAGGAGKLSKVMKSVAPIRVRAFEGLKLTGQTMASLVNPLDGVSGLVVGGARAVGGFARLFKNGVFALTKTGIGRLQTCADRLRAYFGGFASGAAGGNLPNRMNTVVERVTGTVDGAEVVAVRENGKYYALNKNGNPIGPAINKFIALTA